MQAAQNILIVEDDREIATLLSALLSRYGFSPVVSHNADEAFVMLEHVRIELALLDVGLPDLDGFGLLERIRVRSTVPVIMLTSRTETADKVRGLKLGADDYVSKPFDGSELIARVHAVIKRSSPPKAQCVLRRFEGWELDLTRRQLSSPEGIPVLLTNAEFELLNVLSAAEGEPIPRDRIIALVHSRVAEPYDRSADTLVSRLRRKLVTAGAEWGLVRTVRNQGYLLTAEVEEIF